MELEITIKVPLVGAGVSVERTDAVQSEAPSKTAGRDADDHEPPPPDSAPGAGATDALAAPPSLESLQETDSPSARPPALDDLPAEVFGTAITDEGTSLPPGLPDIADVPDVDAGAPPSPDTVPDETDD